MSNLYNAFLGLIPTYPVLIGTVMSVDGESHILELLGGSTIICQSQKVYEIGQRVFIQDKLIISEAPNNPVEQFRV